MTSDPNLCIRCSQHPAIVYDTFCKDCADNMDNLQAEEFDKFLEKTTEDGIPLWLIHERNLYLQQMHEKTDNSNHPFAGNT